MDLSDLRKMAKRGIEPDRNSKSKYRVTAHEVTISLGNNEIIQGGRVDFMLCDDVLEEKHLSRDERRDLLTWYGEVAKKLSNNRKKR